MNERFSFDSFKSKPNEYFTWNISSAFLFDLFKTITYSAVNMHANEICNVKYARQEHWNVGITQYEIGNGDSIMAVEVRRTVCSLNTVKENQIWQFDESTLSDCTYQPPIKYLLRGIKCMRVRACVHLWRDCFKIHKYLYAHMFLPFSLMVRAAEELV